MTPQCPVGSCSWQVMARRIRSTDGAHCPPVSTLRVGHRHRRHLAAALHDGARQGRRERLIEPVTCQEHEPTGRCGVIDILSASARPKRPSLGPFSIPLDLEPRFRLYLLGQEERVL